MLRLIKSGYISKQAKERVEGAHGSAERHPDPKAIEKFKRKPYAAVKGGNRGK